MPDLYTWGAVAVIAIVTVALRFLPFILFRGNKKTPVLVDKLGKALPYAIMGMLVVYCLKGVHLGALSGWLPSLLSCLVVAALYVWKRNTLMSIICGTACYMFLVQAVF